MVKIPTQARAQKFQPIRFKPVLSRIYLQVNVGGCPMAGRSTLATDRGLPAPLVASSRRLHWQDTGFIGDPRPYPALPL